MKKAISEINEISDTGIESLIEQGNYLIEAQMRELGDFIGDMLFLIETGSCTREKPSSALTTTQLVDNYANNADITLSNCKVALKDELNKLNMLLAEIES